jgi:hypothetical protein
MSANRGYSRNGTVSRTTVGVVLLLALNFDVVFVRADDAPGSAPIAATRNQSATASLGTATQTNATKRRIHELINELGDPRYTTRRAAANELRQIGAEAFDLLHTATTSSDPEIAASARYLLRQIAVRWVQSDDSPVVRAVLRDYDTKPDNARLNSVEELAALRKGEGIAALCRIARFDRSPVVSRTAALAIIRPTLRSGRAATPSRVDPEIVEVELGDSSRTAAAWLRHYLQQQRDPAAAVELWQKLVDEEVVQLEANAADTSPEIVSGLLWNLAEIYRQLDNRPAMFGVVDRMAGIDPDSLESTSIELLEWLTENKSWDVLDSFLAKHQSKFEQNKRPLYHAALARAAQGKTEEAERLAETAAKLDPQRDLESFITAKELEENSKFEWAAREYRRNLDDKKIVQHESILCRIFLASMLVDYQKHSEAADVIEPLARAVETQNEVGKQYSDIYRYYKRLRQLDLPTAEALSARLHYYRGLQYRDAKDPEKERNELTLANKFDPNDPDVLIAMYRVTDADEKWRTSVVEKIQKLAKQVDQQIDEQPNDPSNYNQWAWLIANTEGDYQKAIRYSHRSLELIADLSSESAGASFLDTLGRCYFAAGDVENAVKYQREAVAKVDYMQVMNRQLAQFEKALAEKERGARSEERDSGSKEDN